MKASSAGSSESMRRSFMANSFGRARVEPLLRTASWRHENRVYAVWSGQPMASATSCIGRSSMTCRTNTSRFRIGKLGKDGVEHRARLACLEDLERRGGVDVDGLGLLRDGSFASLGARPSVVRGEAEADAVEPAAT